MRYVNIKDYGAVGDGKADDTDAIWAAIDAAINGKIYIPPGMYVVKRKITKVL